MVAILIAILLAALAYWLCALLGLPLVVCVIAAILVLIFGIGWAPARTHYGRRGDL